MDPNLRAPRRAPMHNAATLFLRFALAAAFFSAVADRFGLWGRPGTPGVAWGNFANFEAYTAILNWFLPHSWIPALAWFDTALEVLFGLLLILGLATRLTSFLSAILLLLFALALTFSTGFESALSYSVFTASAGAFLLALNSPYCCSLDNLVAATTRP